MARSESLLARADGRSPNLPSGSSVPSSLRPGRTPNLVTPAVRKAILQRMLMFRQASLDRVSALTNSSPEEIRAIRQELLHSELPERLLQRGAGLALTRELPQAALLYLLVRSARPQRVVETGVRPGYSTAWILAGLERNGVGELFSIGPGSVAGRAAGVPMGTVGEFVPPSLRSRWTLVLGNSTDRLEEVLASAGPVDLFFSDNGPDLDRSQFELRKAWQSMAPGGIVVAHHIDANPAWAEFCQWQGLPNQVLDSGPPPMGALSVRANRRPTPA
ncbi:MAG: class I SAM-dependent methyltransferase [Thermoplasmata archaeon]|nr:class I SAM-dependent methyltransferase [Thermoplasmata archaeon]MCI4358949.1 class I SAM-dependent methyltransferase [Thermoplasmata archaeon]